MRTVAFHGEAFGQFTDWAKADAKLYARLVRLIVETARDPFSGLGKPEPLRHQLKGYWPRRIVYRVTDEAITIISCRNHY